MKKTRTLFSLVLAIAMILSVCSFHAIATTGKLSIDKPVFHPGEVEFHFTDSASDKDFISIYDTSTPDGTTWQSGEIAWAYTTKGASGTVTVDTFAASGNSGKTSWASTPGDYIAKLWSADEYKVELDRVYFTVSKISLDKYTFDFGESITFNYTNSEHAKDFISIYSSSTPDGTGSTNGELDYRYTTDESGTVTFSPSDKPATANWMNTPGDYIAKHWYGNQYKTLMGTVRFTIKTPEAVDITEYYIKKGGTGDGRSVDSPAGTIADVVTNINADGHYTDDLVTVYVIDSGEAAKTVIDNDCVVGYNNSAIGQVPEHKATIRYTSYDENVRSRISHVNYQGANSNASHFLLAGPSIFENIDILDMRNSSAGVTDIYLNWYDAEFKNVNFLDLSHTGTVGTVINSVSHFLLGQTRGHKVVDRDCTVVVHDASIIRGYLCVPGYGNAGQTQGINGTVTLKLLGGTTPWLCFGGSSAKEIIGGNLNVVLKGDTSISKLTGDYDANYPAGIVKGALQLVRDYGTTIPENADIFAYADTSMTTHAPLYHIASGTSNVSLDVTDTTGKYAVTTTKTAYTISEDGKTVYYGNEYLTVDQPGTYTVYEAESFDALLASLDDAPAQAGFVFGGWDTSVEGKISAIYYIDVAGDGNAKVVFIDAINGSDTEHDGLTMETPVQTIATAFSLLSASDKETKKAVIIGDYTINSALPAHSSMITISGDGTGNSNIVRGNNSIAISGPTTFENINFHITVASKFVETQGNKLVIGENVTYTLADGVSGKLTGHTGTYNTNGGMEELEINSGYSSYIGAYYNTETRTTAGAKITINKGNASLTFGADGWEDYGVQYGVVFTDTVSIIQNGGSFTATVSTKYPTGFEADVQIIANNGTELSTLPSFPVEEGYGVYILKAEAYEGSSLGVTDVAGTFTVAGEKTALAVSADGKQYVSANGLLTVPAGEYTVTFEDEVYYTNDGTTIKFYKDFDIDLSTVTHTEEAGKLFVGWTYEDGTAPEDSSFTEGEILHAQYIDFELDTDFYIEGAQIRLADAAKELGEGLRFIIRRTEATNALEITEYGSIVIPSLVAGKAKLELNKTYTYNSSTYTVGKVPAAKLYSKQDGYEQYTICITGIPNDKYATVYAVRGYIMYTDLNGIDKVIYTDYYATNLVNVAELAANDEKVSAENRAYCESLIEVEKQRVRDKYNNLERLALTDSLSGNTVPLDVKYQLGTNGVSVREVVIETGDENAEPLEIFQVTDIHFNYCNEQDFEEANPSVMATYAGRLHLKDGAGVPNAVKTLEYASQGDAIVITGDVLDYLSWGAIELMQKYIWDPYPNAMVTIGNHEITRRCQDNPPTPDPTSLESRYEIVQDNWNHNVYYTSKILDDRVMLIQLDNGSMKFWESQIEPFQKDLDLAREKGYTVLLFYHVPICTYNPNETDLYPIRRNDTQNWNFYDNAEIGYPGTTGATKTVYDMIVNNADVIKATFAGHYHSDYKTEIYAKTPNGQDAIIPQYILTGAFYDGGHALKITVK